MPIFLHDKAEKMRFNPLCSDGKQGWRV